MWCVIVFSNKQNDTDAMKIIVLGVSSQWDMNHVQKKKETHVLGLENYGLCFLAGV